jgi:hypothetical protein
VSHSDDMSRLARELREAYDSRTTAVSDLHAATGRQLAELHAQHDAMATAQRQELKQFAQLLQRDVANKQHDLEVERAALAADQRRRLEAYTHELHTAAERFFAERAAARNADRERQRQHLSASMAALKATTHTCLDAAHKARQALHTDHTEAQRVWREFETEMRQRRAAPKPTATPHQ